MNTATVDPEDLLWMLGMIRGLGGTVIGSRPEQHGVNQQRVSVTWTTGESQRG